MKKRLSILVLATALLPLAFAGGCGKAADLSVCRGLAQQFMVRLARADFQGAYAMADPHAVTEDDLRRIRNNPEWDGLWDHFTSLDHGEGGMLRTEGAFRELRLAPATVRDKPGYIIHIQFREYEEGWKVMALRIETGNETE